TGLNAGAGQTERSGREPRPARRRGRRRERGRSGGRAGVRAARGGPFTISEPARDRDLLVGIELDRVATMSLEVAVEAALGAAEREERHWRGHADVHTQHAGLDPVAVLAGVLAAGSEDARRIAQLVAFHDLHGL